VSALSRNVVAERWWYAVRCGCGFHESIAAPDIEGALELADRAARKHLLTDPDCAPPRLEYGSTIYLPLTGSIGPAVPEREMREHIRRDPCAYCGGQAEHLDHIVPRFSGGTNGCDNLTASCGGCNSRKRTRSLLRFLAAR